jgi:hypothetical protein
MKQIERQTRHIPFDELYALAAPPAGEPEALPAHLAVCRTCGRAFQTIKQAIVEIGYEADNATARRTPADWSQAEREVMAKVRALGTPARRSHPGKRRAIWGGLLAASALLAFWLVRINLETGPKPEPMTAQATSSASMSPADQADDALLRDVARLSEGGEPAPDWKDLAPLPAGSSGEGNS